MRVWGAVSVVVLLFSWLALDDITTDNAASFTVEYACLVLAGLWFIAVGGWLLATRRPVAGLCSVGAVALGVLAFWSLPHHNQPASRVNFLGYLPLAWFLGLAVWMLAAGTRGKTS